MDELNRIEWLDIGVYLFYFFVSIFKKAMVVIIKRRGKKEITWE